MRNRTLAADYLQRAGARLGALDALYGAESWPDVVSEAQKIVELSLKGLLRASGVDPPRAHDVAGVLEAERDRLPGALLPDLPQLAAASHTLRRGLELALWGAEDLTPSEFYRREDADEARDAARFVVERVRPHVLDE